MKTMLAWLAAAMLAPCLLAGTLVATPAGAQTNPVFGSVQVNGPVWIADDHGWQPLALTRPLLAGDRLKTGNDGYLLADLGSLGSVGMFGDTEISAGGSGDGTVIGVTGGRLAFHLAAYSNLEIAAADASIHPLRDGGDQPASGYVEVNPFGDAVVVVENGSLAVSMGESERTLSQGDRLLLNHTALGASPETLGAGASAASRPANSRSLIPATVAPVSQAVATTERNGQTAPTTSSPLAREGETLVAAANGGERERAAGLGGDPVKKERRAPAAEPLMLGGVTIGGDAVGGLTAIGFIGGAVAAGTSNDDSNGSP